MDLGSIFARTIADTHYDMLPCDAVEASKMAVLDTLGCMLAGSGAGEGIESVVGLVDTLGGAGRCTVVGCEKRGNELLAAMANGSLAHSIDYDDAHDDAFVHPSASVVPAALTLGESVAASGKDLIAAVTVGNDLICRLGFAVSNPRENEGLLWMLPVLLGTFSATAASAKILGLSAEETENALGIAYNRAGGSKELVIEPGALRGLYGMFPNMTGVLSALIAKNGVPGLKETFEGKAGFFSVYYGGVYDKSAFDDLGARFEGAGVSIKPWPCCRFTNSHVDAALGLAEDNDIDPARVAHITLYYAAEDVKRCLEPEDVRKNPPSIPGAKLSLPFTVAQAIAYRKIEIGDFSVEALKDPMLLELCAKTSYEYDESLASTLSKTMLPGKVRIELDDARVFERRVDAVYGHPRNRMQWPDLARKFRDCASYAKHAMKAEAIESIIDAVQHLEEVDDVSRIMELAR